MTDLEIQQAREAAARALGLDPATIVWPTESSQPARADDDLNPHGGSDLTDDEWEILQAFLPPEAPQMNAMSQRTFLDAVLWQADTGQSWTSLPMIYGSAEAVRRRFGRWAHEGHWQCLAEALAATTISKRRLRLFQALAMRSEQLSRTAFIRR
jgi:transposase